MNEEMHNEIIDALIETYQEFAKSGGEFKDDVKSAIRKSREEEDE